MMRLYWQEDDLRICIFEDAETGVLVRLPLDADGNKVMTSAWFADLTDGGGLLGGPYNDIEHSVWLRILRWLGRVEYRGHKPTSYEVFDAVEELIGGDRDEDAQRAQVEEARNK